MLTGHSANVASILSLPGPQFLEGRAPDATLEGAAEKSALPLKMLSWKVTSWDQSGGSDLQRGHCSLLLAFPGALHLLGGQKAA